MLGGLIIFCPDDDHLFSSMTLTTGEPLVRWRTFVLSLVLVFVIPCVQAHVAAWHKGMYCLNGTKPGVDNGNNNDPVNPLYMLRKVDWWMHHVNGCDQFPPSPGDFLELPANGEFTVELAGNRAFTTLSSNGKNTGVFGDGQAHPDLGGPIDGKVNPEACISSPNLHTQNESMAAGTIFAISYTSDITQVTDENLVVFTVLDHTPWKRIATYEVPNLPACPNGGCICTWGWVPNGCGEPNIYMQAFRCKVTGRTGSAAVKPGVPPVWCEDDSTKCVRGPKQMIFWNQLEGNNVVVSGKDLAGENRAPTYNSKMGFTSGAQTDIFETAGSATGTYIPPNPSSSSVSSANHCVSTDRTMWSLLLIAAVAVLVR